MPINLDELLAQPEKYPDNVAITVGEGDAVERVALGDLRSRFGAIARERDDAAQKGTVLERTLEALRNAQASRAAGNGAQPGDWQNDTRSGRIEDTGRADDFDPSDFTLKDPYSRKLISTIERMFEDRIPKALKPFQDQTGNAMVGAARLIAALTAKQEFGEAGKWPDGYSPERAYKEAADLGLINRQTGLPDLKRLHYAVTESDRIKTAENAAYERGKAEAEKKIRDEIAASQRSRFKVIGGGNSGAGGKEGGKAAAERPRNLREAFAAIELSPDDISAAALGAAGFQR